MAVTLVTNTLAWPGNNGGTIPSIDTTTATLLLVGMTWSGGFGDTPPVLSDNMSNTFVKRGSVVHGGFTGGVNVDSFVAIFDCLSPTVGSGHTFTITGASSFCTVGVAAFSGGVFTYDTNHGAGVTHVPTADLTSIQPGSITPAANGELLYTFMGNYLNTTAANQTINNSFTVLDTFPRNTGNNNLACAHGYFVQSTAGAINPTWSFTTAQQISTAILTAHQPPATPANTSNMFFAA